MKTRLDLHDRLLGVCNNVYFQPPATVKLKYPCIVYHKNGHYDRDADNDLYKRSSRYKLTVIDADPDSEISEEISKWKYCSWNNSFCSDGLNHDVYILYY